MSRAVRIDKAERLDFDKAKHGAQQCDDSLSPGTSPEDRRRATTA
jgi:hypothetical protein